jgi:hypothetical protein
MRSVPHCGDVARSSSSDTPIVTDTPVNVFALSPASEACSGQMSLDTPEDPPAGRTFRDRRPAGAAWHPWGATPDGDQAGA